MSAHAIFIGGAEAARRSAVPATDFVPAVWYMNLGLAALPPDGTEGALVAKIDKHFARHPPG
eukprot:539667-Lingulodinium_polyedra.AAC.1